MEAKTIFDKIRQDVSDVLNSGEKFLAIPAFLQYLDRMQRDTPEVAEAIKLQHESNLAKSKAVNDFRLAMFDSVISSGKTALTSCILINGGAAVSMLTFVGNLSTKLPNTPIPRGLVCALIFFSIGVLSGGLATAFTYVTQYCYERIWNSAGVTFHIITLVLGFGAYVLFFCGVIGAYHGFI